RSLARSASVTGELSALFSTAQPASNTRMISRPAASASVSNKARTCVSSDSAAAFVLVLGNVTLCQPPFHRLNHLFRGAAEGLQAYLGVLRRFVRRVYSRKVVDLAFQRFRIQSFRIASHAFLERSVDEHLHELALLRQIARQ